jgi:hypothetical protein
VRADGRGTRAAMQAAMHGDGRNRRRRPQAKAKSGCRAGLVTASTPTWCERQSLLVSEFFVCRPCIARPRLCSFVLVSVRSCRSSLFLSVSARFCVVRSCLSTFTSWCVERGSSYREGFYFFNLYFVFCLVQV